MYDVGHIPNRTQGSALLRALEPIDGADGLPESIIALVSQICDEPYLAKDELPHVSREHSKCVPSRIAPAAIAGVFFAQDAKHPMHGHFREL